MLTIALLTVNAILLIVLVSVVASLGGVISNAASMIEVAMQRDNVTGTSLLTNVNGALEMASSIDPAAANKMMETIGGVQDIFEHLSTSPMKIVNSIASVDAAKISKTTYDISVPWLQSMTSGTYPYPPYVWSSVASVLSMINTFTRPTSPTVLGQWKTIPPTTPGEKNPINVLFDTMFNMTDAHHLGTACSAIHSQLVGIPWGSLQYEYYSVNDQSQSGSSYKVVVDGTYPFFNQYSLPTMTSIFQDMARVCTMLKEM